MMQSTKKNVAVMMLVLLVALAGCRRTEVQQVNASEPQEKTVPVMVYQAKQEIISQYLKLTGGIEARNETLVYSKITEKLDQIKVNIGDQVKKNQVLAVQYNQILKQQINQAQAAVQTAIAQDNLAQQDYKRMKQLYQDEIISQQQLDQAETQMASTKASVEQAKAQLTQAKEEYANSFIKAPFAGKVAMIAFDEGDMVAAGQPVMKIVNAGTVKAKLYVPETDIAYISLGQSVIATFPAIPDTEFVGTITRIDEAVDPETRSLEIEVSFNNTEPEAQEAPQNTQGETGAEPLSAEAPAPKALPTLKSGQFGQFQIETQRHPGAIVVPDNALMTQTEVELNDRGEQKTFRTYYTYVITQGKAQKQTVTPGIYSSGRVELTSGVTTGDTVVVMGQNTLKDGNLVKIINSQTTE